MKLTCPYCDYPIPVDGNSTAVTCKRCCQDFVVTEHDGLHPVEEDASEYKKRPDYEEFPPAND